ncbi:MAG TPA: HD domain-containing phosphohydrolase [Solirubrobacteraceae bacterium]|nr:HD domain-containing phosphohydrolase [Solirubrobacteraceae bacterium]
MTQAQVPDGMRRIALVIAAAMCLMGVVIVSLSPLRPVVKPLMVALTAFSVVAELTATRYTGRLTISGSFIGALLAVGFLGGPAGFTLIVVVDVITWIVERYRWQALLLNIAGTAPAALLAGAVMSALDLDQDTFLFVLALAAVGVVSMALNVIITPTLFAMLDGGSPAQALRATRAMLPAVLLNVGLASTAAGIYAGLGAFALSFVLLNVIAFTYMTRLVLTARERTREYASLSWGVLSGLIRTLDERDSRAARHCAAVAAFSRDVAMQVGMSKRDQELAHTAGLLHDIGKFALSDRVMERGGELSESDWRGIRRHPDIGAELLRDIGVYGPVAEIVRAHHERPDGRGYPRRLKGDEIPAIARIVAVAEVYDTLTAPDTYRTPMNSFEALNELRRVAGSQLDPVYVEALADLLSGRGTDYRHADEADFDRELDIERRMNEAAAPSS